MIYGLTPLMDEDPLQPFPQFDDQISERAQTYENQLPELQRLLVIAYQVLPLRMP